jgi:hypothetical protein
MYEKNNYIKQTISGVSTQDLTFYAKYDNMRLR